MTYLAAEDRYEAIAHRRVGRSGLVLPEISFGLWQNFGENRAFSTQREILLRAFDLGIFHFDLANNYGPRPGHAEAVLGEVLRTDLGGYREELVISTKAGWRMGPGPHLFGGSRKYLVSSLEQSLRRLGLDYVDIFYSHRPDPDTPLEETAAALDHAVRSGKALYAGISSYSPAATVRMAELLRDLGTPLTIHQPSYSLANTWIEEGAPSLLDVAADLGFGIIAFSVLAQGLLTGKYLGGVPGDSRVRQGKSFSEDFLSEENLTRIRGLAQIAEERGQTLAELAITWTLRRPQVTSALLGGSSVAQLEANVAALSTNREFSAAEETRIGELAGDFGINIWGGATRSIP